MPAACQWDGKLFGKTVQQDVYVWKVRLTDIFGKNFLKLYYLFNYH